MSAYYINNIKWQKSKTILFPFVYENANINLIKMPLNTYCLLIDENTSYSISDGHLSCIYDKVTNENIFEKECTSIIYSKSLDTQNIIVFDLSHKLELINIFLYGEYSKINKKDKEFIFNFWGSKNSTIKYLPKTNSLLLDTLLNPHKYHEDVAKELGISIREIKKIHELGSKIDFQKEEIIEIY